MGELYFMKVDQNGGKREGICMKTGSEQNIPQVNYNIIINYITSMFAHFGAIFLLYEERKHCFSQQF